MRTTISSDSTRVPPVTAERSPPDSRITGADSPVIADSSTVAMPSTTSPSLGITSPAVDDALVADVERGARDLLDRAVGAPAVGDGLGPRLAQRGGLRLAAAFGHRLGEVGEQHREPQERRRPGRRTRSRSSSTSPRSRKNRIVVSTTPTPTTNITGLRISVARVELDEAVDDRAATMTDRTRLRHELGRRAAPIGDDRGPRSAPTAPSCSTMGPSARAGKNVRPATMTTTPTTRPTNSGVSVGNVPGRRRHRLLAGQRAGDRQRRDDQEEPADQHGDAERRCSYQLCCAVRPANAEPLLLAAEVKV